MRDAKNVCRQRGVRLTAVRERVLELVWQSHKPLGAYTILDQLREDGFVSAPPTVYRALDFLLQQGLVHRLSSLNAFIGCCSPSQHHASQFLICTECGRAAEIDDRKISNAISRSAREHGFQVSNPNIEVAGLCPACVKVGV